MAKVILICGKICVGKSTYAAKFCGDERAVLLSCDEITLALFGRDAGEMHDTYVERTQNYLFAKAAEIAGTGINVVLDWGFWQKEEREYARAFFTSRRVACEFHYLDISDTVWKNRLQKRNTAVLAGDANAYFVDEGLANKFGALFEPPARDEIDVWVDG